MIAQALANGKTVLFVAEKMAALSVVHARLHQLGLGRFCLELHSNKARKLEVIEQLGQALERLPTHEPEQWAREAQKLEELPKGSRVLGFNYDTGERYLSVPDFLPE